MRGRFASISVSNPNRLTDRCTVTIDAAREHQNAIGSRDTSIGMRAEQMGKLFQELQSALIPASLTIGPHFAVSDFKSAVSSIGVEVTTVMAIS